MNAPPGAATVIRRNDLVVTAVGNNSIGISTACVELYLLPHKPTAFTHTTTGFGYSDLYYAHDEGVTWIRGHHKTDSSEVRGMLSALALRSV